MKLKQISKYFGRFVISDNPNTSVSASAWSSLRVVIPTHAHPSGYQHHKRTSVFMMRLVLMYSWPGLMADEGPVANH